MARFLLLATLLSISIPQLFISGVISRTFTIANECNYTVCPGILNEGGSAELSTTGFTLQKGDSKNLTLPPSWTGRIWGRTLCAQNSTGQFSCVTGDCGSGKLECAGRFAAPPVSLAEFTLDYTGGKDFYDVSFVDGYNLPLMVAPQGGKGGKCNSTGCDVDLNGACPSELKVTSRTGWRVWRVGARAMRFVHRSIVAPARIIRLARASRIRTPSYLRTRVRACTAMRLTMRRVHSHVVLRRTTLSLSVLLPLRPVPRLLARLVPRTPVMPPPTLPILTDLCLALKGGENSNPGHSAS